jgi:hypothetical protein
MTMVHLHECRVCKQTWWCSMRDCDLKDECLSCERDEFEDWMMEHGHNIEGNRSNTLPHIQGLHDRTLQ